MKTTLDHIKVWLLVGWVAAMVLANGAGWWWVAIVAAGLLGVGVYVFIPYSTVLKWLYSGINDGHDVDCACANCVCEALRANCFDKIASFQTNSVLALKATNWDVAPATIEGGQVVIMWADSERASYMRVLYSPFGVHLSRRALFVRNDEWFVLPLGEDEEPQPKVDVGAVRDSV